MIRSRMLIVVLTLALSLMGLRSSAQPAGATPNGWSSSGDYATEELGNPWDFSADDDWDIQARYESRGISSAVISGGTLKFAANPLGYVLMGSARYGLEALQWGPSTWLRPINAATYRTLSFRLYSSNPSDISGGFSFYTCGATIGACDHQLAFIVRPGWNNYTFNLGPAEGWAGNIYSIRITPSVSFAGNYELDYVRVLRSGGSLTPVAEPVPVVIEPSRTGGPDFATSTGTPWSFDSPATVADYANLSNVSYQNGTMRACNTNNDPGFILRQNGPIDGSYFNRFYARIFYEGNWSLEDTVGGGMNARVLFRTASDHSYQVSQDIVVYPGWNDIDVELATSPAWAMLDELTTGTGWNGQQIVEVRFDPHEDRGVRCFTVDEMRLSFADVAAPRFDIKFRDDANGPGVPGAGTSADLFLDTAKGSFGGVKIGSIASVANGVNTYSWTSAGVAPGVYWVWVRLRNGAGKESSAYARGSLVVTPPGRIPAGTSTGVDSGATGSAALVNLTMTQAAAPGYITADLCSQVQGLRNSKSNGNYGANQDIANLSVVPIDANQDFCVFNSADLHLLADVQGVFGPNGSLSFSPLQAPRFDTRRGAKPSAGTVVEVATGAPAGTQAVLVNLTMTEAEAPGYITADRCSALRNRNGDPQFSNGNYAVGQNIANLGVVPVDANGSFCIFVSSRVNVIADVQGRFATSGAYRFTLTPNVRTDTRSGPKPVARTKVRAATGLPAGTPFALVNLTMTQAEGGGYITAGPCSTVDTLVNSQSNGNYRFGADIANLGVVALDADGGFCVFVETPVHLVIDVQGSFRANGQLGFDSIGPLRQLDSRNGSCESRGAFFSSPCARRSTRRVPRKRRPRYRPSGRADR